MTLNLIRYLQEHPVLHQDVGGVFYGLQETFFKAGEGQKCPNPDTQVKFFIYGGPVFYHLRLAKTNQPFWDAYSAMLTEYEEITPREVGYMFASGATTHMRLGYAPDSDTLWVYREGKQDCWNYQELDKH